MIDVNNFNYMNTLAIQNSFIKTDKILNQHKIAVVSISGGADSDIVLDLISRIQTNCEIHYVWFNTGIEYRATKEHLDYLEKKYGVIIEREKAFKSIPLCVKEYGQPFCSKMVSQMIERLQKNDFKWEDKSYDELIKKYPHCKSSIKWWCNYYDIMPDGKVQGSKFSISRNKYLKRFLIDNPPTFKISPKCCNYAKKKTVAKVIEEYHADLNIMGVRKAEGGLRAVGDKCYTPKNDCSIYRPIFWYTQDDKKEYEKSFNIVHSKCYTDYGMKRTGCAGCPFDKQLDKDVLNIYRYEPQLYKACTNIFRDSYEYTKKYQEYVKNKKLEDIKKLKT